MNVYLVTSSLDGEGSTIAQSVNDLIQSGCPLPSAVYLNLVPLKKKSNSPYPEYKQ